MIRTHITYTCDGCGKESEPSKLGPTGWINNLYLAQFDNRFQESFVRFGNFCCGKCLGDYAAKHFDGEHAK